MNTMINRTRTTDGIRRTVVTACLTALAFGADVWALQAPVQSQSRAVVTTVSDDEKDVIEIRIEDGKLSVKRNGLDVPDARIRREGGRIVILDESGNAVDEANVWTTDGEEHSIYEFSQTEPFADAMAMYRVAAREGAPKVMIGVHTAKPGPALEKHLRLEPGKAIMISGLYEGMPANKAGLEQYDIVIKIDGAELAEGDGIAKCLADKKAGESVKLSVIHEGQPKEVVVTLEEYDGKKLQEMKLIGGTPLLTLFGESLSVPNLKNLADPQWQGFVYSPENNEFFQQLETFPADGQFWRGRVEGAPSPKVESDLDARNKRLDDRLAELEKMLGKLVEQNQRTR
jgi:serine protease Do